jgi:hypothetical protein
MGLEHFVWPRLRPAWRPLGAAGLAVAVLPSNLLVYAATLGAVAARDPAIFWTAGEAAALAWLADQAEPGSLVAASPSTGLFIPARTDARVIYGHPFETASAAERRAAVEAFFTGQVPAGSFVAQNGIDFVFYGPRERELAPDGPPGNWPVVFSADGVEVYAP